MPKSKKQTDTPDYEQLGRLLKNVYESGYADRKRLLYLSFLRGIATGLGSIIGATIVLALLLWVLSLFDTLPLIGPVIENVQDTVNRPTSN